MLRHLDLDSVSRSGSSGGAVESINSLVRSSLGQLRLLLLNLSKIFKPFVLMKMLISDFHLRISSGLLPSMNGLALALLPFALAPDASLVEDIVPGCRLPCALLGPT